MVFAVARTALLAARRQAPNTAFSFRKVATNVAKRRMGGSAAPAPEWTGIDKVVRDKFPGDDQLAGAIISGYFGLFILYKIKSALSGSPADEPAPVAVAPAAASAGSIPDVGSEEFGAFLESEENVAKLVESIEN